MKLLGFFKTFTLQVQNRIKYSKAKLNKGSDIPITNRQNTGTEYIMFDTNSLIFLI